MTGCVVCDHPEGYCEFCPCPDNIDTGPEEAEDISYKFDPEYNNPIDASILDPARDEQIVLVGEAPSRETAVEELSNVVFLPEPRISARTYRVTYKSGGFIHRTTTMTLSDDFFEALEQATEAALEGEAVAGMEEMV